MMNADQKELVKKRVESQPDSFLVYIGGVVLKRDDIIREVEDETPLGEEFVKNHMRYLHWWSDGNG